VFDGEQQIPEYTINSQTIDLLYDAAVEAEDDRRRVQLVAEGYRQRLEEYKAESEPVYRISSYKGRIQINACLDYRPGGLRVSKEINAGSRIKARAIVRISSLVLIYRISSSLL